MIDASEKPTRLPMDRSKLPTSWSGKAAGPAVEFTQGTPATPPSTDVAPDRRGTQEKPGP